MGRDRHPDGVRVDPATPDDLATYPEAQRQIGRMQVPLLHDGAKPGSRLFVMAVDGTGNDKNAEAREDWTNVALLHEQAREIQRNNPSVAGGYVAGPGTQDAAVPKLLDQITGYTFQARVEEGYRQFIVQAKKWLHENPGAEISAAAVGFSRGAEQAAAFTRLVHERGIQDPDSARYERNAAGEITGVTYTQPPLVPPGQVKQAAVLFDPVATGRPMDHDRRLPPSVMGGLQISALHEQRDQFRSTEAMSPGLSPDRRFLQVWVAGAHSNIGGSYSANGLSDRSFNLATEYLNHLSDRPLFTKRPESLDPAMNVIHRSHEHQWVYTQRGFRDGQRDVVQQLAPPSACRPVPALCHDREPQDAALAATVTWRDVRLTPNPVAGTPGTRDAPTPIWQQTPSTPRSAADEVDALFDRLSAAAMAGDQTGMRAASRDYVRLDSGQAWRASGRQADPEPTPSHAPTAEPAPTVAIETTGPRR